MNSDEFRKSALELPEATEGEHQGHPDFRIAGKIFATLGPSNDWAMIKLTSEAQSLWTTAQPDVFEAFPGAWGKGGATRVTLEGADLATVRQALIVAWRRTAPKKMVDQYDSELDD